MITITVNKETVESKVGLGLKLRQSTGIYVVSKIQQDGVFAGTALRVGMRVVSVNDVELAVTKRGEAISLFSDAAGPLTVVAVDDAILPGQKIVAYADKATGSPHAKLGIGINELTTGGLVISSISRDGLFYQTGLRVGMKLIGVNKNLVDGMSKKDAVDLLKSSSGPARVSAQEMDGSVVASVTKKALDTRLGIGLSSSRKYPGAIMVTSLAEENGLFYDTPLRVGMYLVCINDQYCTGWSVSETIQLLKDAHGPVKVYASTEPPSQALQQAPKGGLMQSFRGSSVRAQ